MLHKVPIPPRTRRRRTGGQLKTWVTTIKAELEPLSSPRVFGHALWRKDWVNVSSELTQDRQTWSDSVRDVVTSIANTGSTRSGGMPTQVQISTVSAKAVDKALKNFEMRQRISPEALVEER